MCNHTLVTEYFDSLSCLQILLYLTPVFKMEKHHVLQPLRINNLLLLVEILACFTPQSDFVLFVDLDKLIPLGLDNLTLIVAVFLQGHRGNRLVLILVAA